MKKVYEIPETEVIETFFTSFMGDAENSGVIGPGHNSANENKTFEEEIISSDTGKPNLWDE